MDLATLTRAAAAENLAVMGAFHCRPDDHAPDGAATLVLLGPGADDFWPQVTAAPEFADGQPDPLDRWSRRVIDALARDLHATALFPFGGPPYAPFIAWAKRSGRAWSSPAGLLVHGRAGLMVSYRGALAFAQKLDLGKPPEPKPCLDCAAPCLSACPVNALGPEGYDTAACHAYLDTAPGRDCLDNGCKARRACPVSAGAGRSAAQSAFHMAAFHPGGGA